jgi:Mce-associated membrane protein
VTSPDDPAAAPGPALLRWGVLAVLGVLVVGSLAVLGLQAAHRGGNPFSTTDDVQDARDDVMSQARRFLVRVNTYGPDLLKGTTMPAYRERVSAVVTAKFRADFEKNVPYAEATVAQAGLARTTEVYGVGVGDLDLDRGRATALVSGAFTNSFPDPKDKTKRVPADPQPYRVEVTLVRQGGAWRVDAFTPVGADASQSPGATPSTPASPSAPASSPAASGGAQ